MCVTADDTLDVLDPVQIFLKLKFATNPADCVLKILSSFALEINNETVLYLLLKEN